MNRSLPLALALWAPAALAQPFPATPWPGVRHVSLEGTCLGALVPRPGGGAAVMLGPTPAITILGANGNPERSIRTESRLAEDPWWVGRDALHALRGRDLLMALGADGTVRGYATLPEPPVGHTVIPGSRTSLLVFSGSSGLLASSYDWDASPRAAVPAGGWRTMTLAPVATADGAAWIAAGSGIVRISQEPSRIPLLRGLRRMAPRAGGGFFALVEGAALAIDGQGNRVGQHAIDATVIDLVPRTDGGATLLLQGAPPRVIVLDSLANLRASFTAPPDARSLTPGTDGAVLVSCRDGTLAVFETDGTPRWALRIPGPLRPPVVPLGTERFGVATERDELIVLELARPSGSG